MCHEMMYSSTSESAGQTGGLGSPTSRVLFAPLKMTSFKAMLMQVTPLVALNTPRHSVLSTMSFLLNTTRPQAILLLLVLPKVTLSFHWHYDA